MDDDFEARSALAAAARRMNQSIRVTGVDSAAMAEATRRLHDLAHLLAEREIPGPHSQLYLGPLADKPQEDHDLRRPERFFYYSPVVGPLSPISPLAQFWVDADNALVGTVAFSTLFAGPPFDFVHGGVIAEVFDELLGTAGAIGAQGGMTGRLIVNYHKPTPLDAEIGLRGWVDRVEGRKTIVKGQMRHGDVTTASAEGLFISVNTGTLNASGES